MRSNSDPDLPSLVKEKLRCIGIQRVLGLAKGRSGHNYSPGSDLLCLRPNYLTHLNPQTHSIDTHCRPRRMLHVRRFLQKGQLNYR